MPQPADKSLILSTDNFVFIRKGSGLCIETLLSYKPSSQPPFFCFNGLTYTWNRRHPNPHFLADKKQYYSRESTTLTAVPENYIRMVYDPFERYQQIKGTHPRDQLEDDFLSIGYIFEESGIPPQDIGITGTVLIECQTVGKSDLDIVLRGADNFRVARDVVKMHPTFKELSPAEWEQYFDTYKLCHTDFPNFLRTAQRKHDRAFFNNSKISIFGIRNDAEQRLSEDVNDIGEVALEGEISGDRESAFHPAFYGIDMQKSTLPQYNVTEIAALGREYYLEGFVGDHVRCMGRLQQVTIQGSTHYRVLVGRIDKFLNPSGNLHVL
ncbi:MAG: hypothetical protein WC613_03800 [Candidatus Aenigmatarchaeota archaeon]